MTQSGILVVDKPAGMTSHDVVGRVRRVLGTRRVGHAGTLDPDATGVLVVCVGEACRLVEYLGADQKTYEASVVFGTATDTDDAAGQVLRVTSVPLLTGTDVREAARQFLGTQLQRTPRVSAVHVNGRRAYERARAGEDFDVPVREVIIHSLEVFSLASGDTATACFRVTCSKGTYIRALCRDWGAALGVPAHMGTLRRVQSGTFSIGDAVPLEEWAVSSHPDSVLLPMSVAVQALPALTLADEGCTKLAMGQSLTLDAEDSSRALSRQHAGSGGREDTAAQPFLESSPGPAAAFAADGSLAAVVEVNRLPAGLLVAPKKVFWKKDK